MWTKALCVVGDDSAEANNKLPTVGTTAELFLNS